MKKAILLLLFAAASPTANTFPDPARQVGPRNCRIVDLVPTRGGEVNYVDGIRVPDETGLLNFLRQREKASPRSCLLVFTPLMTTVRQLEDLRVIAGKMQYEDFHLYVYESQYRDTVNELLFGRASDSGQLRLTPRGPLPWPDHSAEVRPRQSR